MPQREFVEIRSGQVFFGPWRLELAFAEDVFESVQRAAAIARHSDSTQISSDHLLAGILHARCAGTYVLCDPVRTPKEQMDDRAMGVLRREFGLVPIGQIKKESTALKLAPVSVTVLNQSRAEATRFRSLITDSMHVALSLLKHGDAELLARLEKSGVTYASVYKVCKKLFG